MAERSDTTFTVRIPKELRTRLTSVAEKRGKSATNMVVAAVTTAIESAEEQPLESRLVILEKATTKNGRRLEDLFAVVRSIEDDEKERRRQERKGFTDTMAENYTSVAEAIAANTAVVEALFGEVRANREAAEKLNQRLDAQATMLVALIHGATEKGVRASYHTIQRSVTNGEKKLEEFQIEAMKRGV